MLTMPAEEFLVEKTKFEKNWSVLALILGSNVNFDFYVSTRKKTSVILYFSIFWAESFSDFRRFFGRAAKHAIYVTGNVFPRKDRV